jgi:peptidoglycan/LPS O-acetylase OafA/YrhL
MALSVAVYHFTTWWPVLAPGGVAAGAAAKAGHYAVEGFFIISGFCFFHLYGAESFRGRGLWDFHLKRFLRIAPLYYAAVGANLLLGLPVGPEPTWRMVAENATLTFGLFHPNHSLVMGGWSIGIEYVFYLAFPLLAWARGRWRLFLPMGCLLLLSLSLPWTLLKVPAAPHAGDLKFHAYVQVANHAFLFFLGGLVAAARARLPFRLGRPAFLALAGLAVFLFVWRERHFYDHFEVMQGPVRYLFNGLCFALVAVFAFREFPPSPLRKMGVFLGDISYSVYLLHPFAQAFLPKGLSPWAGFAGGLAITLGLATLTHRIIERPAMGLARRLTR